MRSWYDEGMDATRKRRIVGRALIGVLVVALLPVGYVGSVMGLLFSHRAGWFSMPGAYVEPLILYVQNEYPGHQRVRNYVEWADAAGRDMRR